jgi:hypothetical protein
MPRILGDEIVGLTERNRAIAALVSLKNVDRAPPRREEHEEATVDAYGESEQMTGFYTMIEEHLAVPFKTDVLGVEVTVERIDMTDDEQIVAVCARDLAARSSAELVNALAAAGFEPRVPDPGGVVETTRVLPAGPGLC